MPQKVVLDIDDASIIRTEYPLIRRLLERYPNLKISLFFVPYDAQAELVQLIKIYRGERLKELHELLDMGVLELIPHGLTHAQSEFEKADKYTCRLCLKAIDDVMKKDNLPYVKGFKAPYWLYNQNLVDVLNEQGWWLAVNRDDPRALKTKKFYEYNYSIHEPFWLSKEPVWKLHSHMFSDRNDIGEHFLDLLKIPVDAEFHFASEFIEDNHE